MAEPWSPAPGLEAAARRAPFSANPEVGDRGRRSRQRIVDAALRCFDELGYERTTVDRITRAAGCSRAAYYQYFSSKEELFRQLGAQAIAELDASMRALGAITPEQPGWDELHGWVTRHDATYDRHEPLFRAYDAAVALDDQVAADAGALTARYSRALGARVAGATLPDRRRAAVLALLHRVATRAKGLATLMATTSPDPALDGARVATAVTDVAHRTLFGTNLVNARAPVPPAAARRDPLRTAFLELLDSDPVPSGRNASARRTRAALLDAAQRVLLANGYHRTRVSAITAAAGQSHGIFYHYFAGKQAVTQALARRALRRLVEAYERMPDLGGAGAFDPEELRTWLRDYGRSHAQEGGMIRAWIDSTDHDPVLLADAAAGLEWARQHLATVLARRGFGDPAADGLVLVALLELLGSPAPSRPPVEAVALCVERGLVGSAGPGA